MTTRTKILTTGFLDTPISDFYTAPCKAKKVSIELRIREF